MKTSRYYLFFIFLLLVSCIAGKLSNNDYFINKKFVSVHSLSMNKFVQLDTIQLTSDYKQLDANFTIHFQGDIVRINERIKSNFVFEQNEKGIDGTTQYYENKAYYGKFLFNKESNQLKIYNLNIYVYDDKDDLVQLLTLTNIDTLIFTISNPDSKNLCLIRLN